MVAHGRSIAVRGTKNLFFQTQRPTRRDADRREAIVAAYEIASPEMIESGDCAALLEAHAADLGRLLFRVQHRFEADDDAPNSVLSDDDGGGDDDDDEPPPDARYDDDGAWSDASWSDADELGPRTP